MANLGGGTGDGAGVYLKSIRKLPEVRTFILKILIRVESELRDILVPVVDCID